MTTILVVEDDGILALYLSMLLRKQNYTVLPAVASGEAAIASAMQHSPDLILMDISLKGEMSGIAAAGVISEKRSVPIIFTTSYDQESLLSQSQSVARYGYLVKPLGERDLAQAVEAALGRQVGQFE